MYLLGQSSVLLTFDLLHWSVSQFNRYSFFCLNKPFCIYGVIGIWRLTTKIQPINNHSNDSID